MAVCHKCPHNLTDSAGELLPEFRGRDFDSLPCSGCPLIQGFSIFGERNRSNQGESVVQMQGLEEEGLFERYAPSSGVVPVY